MGEEPEPLDVIVSAAAGAEVVHIELAGEEAAVAAFRRAQSAHPARPAQIKAAGGAVGRAERSPEWRPLAGGWRLALALVTGTLVLAAVVGLAVAAPSMSGIESPPSVALLGSGDAAVHRDVPSSRSPHPTPPAPTTISIEPTVTPGATDDLGLAALCEEYFDIKDKNRARALKKPKFAQLVSAAGGPENVDAFCIATVVPPPAPTAKKK